MEQERARECAGRSFRGASRHDHVSSGAPQPSHRVKKTEIHTPQWWLEWHMTWPDDFLLQQHGPKTPSSWACLLWHLVRLGLGVAHLSDLHFLRLFWELQWLPLLTQMWQSEERPSKHFVDCRAMILLDKHVFVRDRGTETAPLINTRPGPKRSLPRCTGHVARGRVHLNFPLRAQWIWCDFQKKPRALSKFPSERGSQAQESKSLKLSSLKMPKLERSVSLSSISAKM